MKNIVCDIKKNVYICIVHTKDNDKEIEIRNNFEVPLGAEFILDIDN